MSDRLVDRQRARVYAWEDEAIPTTQLPYLDLHTDVREIVDRIGKLYGISAPINLKDGRGCKAAKFKTGEYAIVLPRWARTMPVVLHEAAHWVTFWIYRKDYAVHGREFVAVFMYLLNRFHGVPLDYLTMTANRASVDFASIEDHKPRSKRK